MANRDPQQNPAVTEPRDGAGWGVLGVAVGFSVLLAVSHCFFLVNADHRIGGVAWNAVFQLFGSLFAGGASLFILFMGLLGQMSRLLAAVSALLLAATGGYCLLKSLDIMMGV